MPLKTRGELTVSFIAQCYTYLNFYVSHRNYKNHNCL